MYRVKLSADAEIDRYKLKRDNPELAERIDAEVELFILEYSQNPELRDDPLHPTIGKGTRYVFRNSMGLPFPLVVIHRVQGDGKRGTVDVVKLVYLAGFQQGWRPGS